MNKNTTNESISLSDSVNIKLSSIKKFQSKEFTEDEMKFLSATIPDYPFISIDGKYYLIAIAEKGYKGVVWCMDWFEFESVYREKNNTCHVNLNFAGKSIDVSYGT